MSDTTTRKAVVTTAQVRDAFGSYAAAQVRIGNKDLATHEFDKGARGKGFAEYDGNGNVVRSFETKDEALNFYGLTAAGMWLVLDATQVDEAPESDAA